MSETLTRFEMKGWYKFKEKRNPFTGSLTIETAAEPMVVDGYISDPNSVYFPLQHVVEGSLVREQDGFRLKFIKKPVGSMLADIHYALLKVGNGGFDGTYKGAWSFKEADVLKLDLSGQETERQNAAEIELL